MSFQLFWVGDDANSKGRLFQVGHTQAFPKAPSYTTALLEILKFFRFFGHCAEGRPQVTQLHP